LILPMAATASWWWAPPRRPAAPCRWSSGLQRLVEGIDIPMAVLTRDGLFVGASEAARPLLGFRNLSEVGLDGARSDALRHGRVETAVGIGHLILQRVGTGADVGLVALIAPGATQAAHARHVAPASPENRRGRSCAPARGGGAAHT